MNKYLSAFSFRKNNSITEMWKTLLKISIDKEKMNNLNKVDGKIACMIKWNVIKI